MSTDELAFLLKLVRLVVGGRGWALTFERIEGNALRIECCAPYSRPVVVEARIGSASFAESSRGTVMSVHDVASEIYRKVRTPHDPKRVRARRAFA
jgi:hypothetical protein